jgi:DNA-binding GntR family transcriptional regulator
MTVRRAIQELESEGLVISRQGRGVFVRDAPLPSSTSSSEYVVVMQSLTEIRDELRSLRDRVSEIESRVQPDRRSSRQAKRSDPPDR